MIKEIRLAGILAQSGVNGLGLRKVFFSQGCKHACPNCFSPHTWPFEGGQIFNIDDLVKSVEREPYLNGVTFSGGDPLQQVEAFAAFAQKLKLKKINIWCYTGYTWEQVMENMKHDVHLKTLINNLDVLVDGKYIDKLQSTKYKYRGSSNQRLIDVPASLKQKKIVEISLK